MLFKKINIFVILCFFCILLSLSTIYFLLQSNKFQADFKSEVKSNGYLKDQLEEYRYYRLDNSKLKPTPTKLDIIGNNNLKHFIASIYLKFPDFQKLVDSKNITRVFQFQIKEEYNTRGMGGFLVEVERIIDSNKTYSFYLVTSKFQKELINPMSAYADNAGVFCLLNDYLLSGGEVSLGRNLIDKNGYIILSGKCGGYGSGRFVSVYKISTGEKILLKGNVELSGTIYKGISETGNALGGVRGVFGVNNPTIVVEFGNDDESAATLPERLSNIGFFDLQTGNLKQLVNFN